MKKRILVFGGSILLLVGIAVLFKGGWWETIGAAILISLGGIMLYEGMAKIFWLKSIFKMIDF